MGVILNKRSCKRLVGAVRRIQFLMSAVLIMVYVFFPVSHVNAAIDKNATVAVMDFGTRPGATEREISLNNMQHTSCDYVIQRLVESKCFSVMEKDLMLEQIKAKGLSVCGIIDQDSAKAIGDMLKVRYLIYGNIANVSVSSTGTHFLGDVGGGVDVCTVKAHIVMRIMDVETGDIVMMAKGDGSSKSSYVSMHAGNQLLKNHTVKIGTTTVTQDSVHNAIMKAAYAGVDKITSQLMAGN